MSNYKWLPTKHGIVFSLAFASLIFMLRFLFPLHDFVSSFSPHSASTFHATWLGSRCGHERLAMAKDASHQHFQDRTSHNSGPEEYFTSIEYYSPSLSEPDAHDFCLTWRRWDGPDQISLLLDLKRGIKRQLKDSERRSLGNFESFDTASKGVDSVYMRSKNQHPSRARYSKQKSRYPLKDLVILIDVCNFSNGFDLVKQIITFVTTLRSLSFLESRSGHESHGSYGGFKKNPRVVLMDSEDDDILLELFQMFYGGPIERLSKMTETEISAGFGTLLLPMALTKHVPPMEGRSSHNHHRIFQDIIERVQNHFEIPMEASGDNHALTVALAHDHLNLAIPLDSPALTERIQKSFPSTNIVTINLDEDRFSDVVKKAAAADVLVGTPGMGLSFLQHLLRNGSGIVEVETKSRKSQSFNFTGEAHGISYHRTRMEEYSERVNATPYYNGGSIGGDTLVSTICDTIEGVLNRRKVAQLSEI